MIPFEYAEASSPEEAIRLATNRPDATYLAGGTNLVDHMKLGLIEPQTLIDIRALPYGEIRLLPDGTTHIGALASNSDVGADLTIRDSYPALSRAVLSAASPQIRNVATVGGNLLQRTRCPYFRDRDAACNKRVSGSGCSAMNGYSRDGAILGASDHCIATHPSDMAVALTAYGATVVVHGAEGPRELPIGEVYRDPGSTPSKETTLDDGDLIVAIRLPRPAAGEESLYRKARDRASFAFALVSTAVRLSVRDDRVDLVRIALGGVAPRPWRAARAEAALSGSAVSEAAVRNAIRDELSEARPLPSNAFKVDMAANLVVEAVMELAGQREAGS